MHVRTGQEKVEKRKVTEDQNLKTIYDKYLLPWDSSFQIQKSSLAMNRVNSIDACYINLVGSTQKEHIAMVILKLQPSMHTCRRLSSDVTQAFPFKLGGLSSWQDQKKTEKKDW